jgi:hypothetical protein
MLPSRPTPVGFGQYSDVERIVTRSQFASDVWIIFDNGRGAAG